MFQLSLNIQDRDLFDEATRGILRSFTIPHHTSIELMELLSLHVQLRQIFESNLIFEDIILERRVLFDLVWRGDLIEMNISIRNYVLVILQLQIVLDALESGETEVILSIYHNVSSILKFSSN